MKKTISLLLIAVLLVACMTTTAFAAYPGETVTVTLYATGSEPFTDFDANLNVASGLTINSGTVIGAFGYYNAGAVSYATTTDLEGTVGVFTLSVTIDAGVAPGKYTITGTSNNAYNAAAEAVEPVTLYAEVIVECDHVAGTPVEETHTSATCTTDGCVDTVTYCTKCSTELDRVHSTLPATGHSYTSVVTAPTCTEEGYTTYTCACGDSYIGDKVPATGHSYTSEVTTAATCTTDGVKTHTCPACGDTYTEVIPATGHKYDWVDNGDGTHTGTCACGDTITENHTWGEDGKTCNKCGATKPTEPSEGPTKPTEGPGKHETGDITPYPVFFLMAAAVIGTAYGFKRKIVK